jgi:hypothetical protein
MAISKSFVSMFPVLLLATAGCASAAPPASAPPSASAPLSESPSAPASASASAPAPTSAPLPTGGSVRVGDVVAPPSFDPKPTLDVAKPELLVCYNLARQNNSSLHGKLNLRIHVNEAGAVLLVDAEPGGSASDPTLVSCMGDAFKLLRFPKPGGMATLVVPLVFHP